MASSIGCAKRAACARCTLASRAFPQWVLPNGLAAVLGPGIFNLRRALRRPPLRDARRFSGCGVACSAFVCVPDRQAARARMCSRGSRAGAGAPSRASPCGVEKNVLSAALRFADEFRLTTRGGACTAVGVAGCGSYRLVSRLSGFDDGGVVGDVVAVSKRDRRPQACGSGSLWGLRRSAPPKAR